MNDDDTLIKSVGRPEPRKLNGYQEELHRTLMERNPLFADMYLGALMVLEQTEIPNRIALCAHSVRELIDRVMRTVDAPIVKGPDTASLMHPIADAWEELVDGDGWPGNPPWEKPMDGKLKGFLKRCQTLIPKIKGTRKTNKEQASVLIEQHNFHSLSLPPQILQSRASEWLSHRTLFVEAGHHGHVEEAQFRNWLALFEEFLLNLLKPRTFVDQKNIKKMIEEAERANT